jgi:2-polyprenyl-3-methyl-5-hydroxy-6-metoxy-1,4-benzoquinol methylase
MENSSKYNCNCIICESEGNVLCKDYQGYLEGEKFTIFNCKTCNLNWPAESSNLNFLYENIYKNANKIPGYSKYLNIANSISNKKNPKKYLADNDVTYFGIISYLENNCEKSSKILEVGCGFGYLTYALKKADYDIVGIDISQKSIEFARANFGDNYILGDIANLNSDIKFDVIILTEVIEHIPDPINFLKILKNNLAPSGKIILSTPNKDVYPSETIWSSDLPPVHQFWFGQNSIRKICFKLDMRVKFLNLSRFYLLNPEYIDLAGSRDYINQDYVLDKSGNTKLELSKTSTYQYLKFKLFKSLIYRFAGFYLHIIYLMFTGKNIQVLGKSSNRLIAVLSF